MRFSPESRPARLAICYLLSLSSVSLASAADADKTTTSTACTASSTSGAFFDLRQDIALKLNPDGSKPAHSNGAPIVDYKAKGYDYGANFTLNICAAVVEPVDGVIGVDSGKWQNVSAYYTSKGDVYSLGSQSSTLVSRGKELVLQYTGGSPCGKNKKREEQQQRRRPGAKRSSVHGGAAYRDPDYEREADAPSATGTGSAKTAKETDEPKRRKSATIFFSCDRDPGASTAQVSFIATDPEECSYVFKVKSQNACAGVEPHKPGSVGPGSVFFIIFAIAVLVYLLGGIFYQRTVANARGWKQLPNYSLWASVWSHICDFFVIVTSSCARFLPNRRGYHYVSGSPSGRGRSSREDENRLIDQYDEEWED
ncbi:mannose 6-phosphate receptor domain-containing protein [Annulohypoxylon maeteangense]|uniref:mannose 6-phosphate receptor domain-containing protein n=1 Tax=Annulohypoxylon maeteangense TaxID=1927788 RepID=UPI0020087D10|nr:mannose 6-phosphate receptor domain-containing protein [Annulohypoxylon maeteangense]KAI0883502.1 mannose 6-phosphate receptor domain-containing protein [Annulohypoxylon maeteangense]